MTICGARLRAVKSCAIVAAGFTLSGCGTIGDMFRELRDTAAAKPAFTDSLGEAPFNLAKDCMPSSQNAQGKCVLPILSSTEEKGTGGSTYHRISSLTDTEKQVLWRNRFQDFLIWRSDKQCQAYKSSIIATQNGVNFGLNTLTTGAAGVAAVVVAPATNILGAIAAISNGIRGHFNEDFYQRFVAAAIVMQIDKQRANQLTAIMLKRGVATDSRPTFPTDVSATATSPATRAFPTVPAKIVLPQDYTLEESIGDAERYHQMCSATVALASLVKDNNKFDDTSTGIKSRLAELNEQMKANNTQIAALDSAKDAETITKLREANTELSRQIVILQRMLLTAPTTRP